LYVIQLSLITAFVRTGATRSIEQWSDDISPAPRFRPRQLAIRSQREIGERLVRLTVPKPLQASRASKGYFFKSNRGDAVLNSQQAHTERQNFFGINLTWSFAASSIA
jgi:hypothetical protein